MSNPSVPEKNDEVTFDKLAFDDLLDASGLSCPLPLLKTKQSLNKLNVGDVLKVIATDAGSWRDIQVFVDNSVNELLHAEQDQGHYCYWIKKGNR
ncbi:sulfurtransferase TusA family protein [Litoribrevibacter euphylliae]|uniref:Sulfurtransferase TusA family protein n=1 Tax=Litoribrevibacter euphylliae TaxID=1834034 RepID=A0ABV7HCX2_9GAMM